MSGSIPAERYARRISQAQQLMTERGVSGLLIGVGADLRWLTGYAAMPLKRLTMLVVPAYGRALLVVPRLELAAAMTATAIAAGVTDVATWEETEDPAELVSSSDNLGTSRGTGDAQRLLVSDRLAAAFLLGIQARLPNAEFGLSSAVLSELRQVKDREEAELLRRAATAADRTVSAISSGKLVGRSESDVAREVRDRLLDEGHDQAVFAIVASGPNSASPHHEASDRVIAKGEPIVLDIGGTIEGYGSDTTRTIWVTGGDDACRPDETYRSLFVTLERAQRQATAAALPGVTAESVDGVARGIISAAGYGDAFIHRTGHGIGLEGHEDPYLVAGNGQPLRDGHAFSVEPGIYLEGRYGARIEDIVICRQGQPDVLNQVPRGLAIVSGT